MSKQASESAELICQMERERKAALDEKEMEFQEKEDALEDLKKELQNELEAVRQKEKVLDEAVRAVTEMPSMDEAVDYILDHATIEIRTSPECPVTFPFVARRYLDYIRSTQKKEAERACMKVKKVSTDDESGAMQLSKKESVAPVRRKTARKAPEYTFSGAAQPDNGIGF